VVFKNLVVHPNVTLAHKAGCAAGKQGKFQQFKAVFWEKGFKAWAQGGRDEAKLGEENILAMAREVGLDPGKLKSDMNGADCQAMLTKDQQELQKFNVNSTPTFFINGKHVPGALGKDQFKKHIDERMKVAEASGVSGAEYYEKEIMGKGEKQFRSKVDPKPH
jgi:protein-disulfide isomerase